MSGLTSHALSLFESQHGVAARADLVPVLGKDVVDSLHRHGCLVAVERGIYRLPGSAVTPEMEAMAATERARPDARLTGPFVLGQLHLDGFTRHDPFEVLTAPGRRLRGVGFAHRPDPMPHRRITRVGSLPCVHPVAALVDSLPGREDREQRVALHVVRRRGFWSDQRFHLELAARGENEPGVATLLRLLDAGVLASDTAEEVALGERLRAVDEGFEPQVWITPTIRVDWFHRRWRLGTEYQGEVDHAHAEGRLRDSGRFEAAAAIGVLLVPIVAADLRDPGFDDWVRSIITARSTASTHRSDGSWRMRRFLSRRGRVAWGGMGEVIRVTDPGDPRLGDYACLSDPQLRKRYEHDVGVFIAEGPNVVRELVGSSYVTKSMLLMPHRLDDLADCIEAVDGPVFLADRELVRQVVRFPNHQGALACGHRRQLATPEEVLAGARTVVVLEETNDPANLGAIFRSARALHVDAVLLGPRCADPLYRRTVRTSMGHVLHVPFATAPDLEGTLADLRARGFRVLALTPDPAATDLADLPPLDRVALLLGAEGPGLSEEAIAGADLPVRVPIDPAVDSLNVAVTAGIAFDALRRGRDRTPAVPPSPSPPR